MKKKHLFGAVALGAAASLALVGCAGGTPEEPTDTNTNGDSSASEDLGTITLGFLPAWTDGLSLAYLAQDQLEKLGYTVEFEELTEAGVLFTALANGDVDVYPSAWLPVTHGEYMEQYEGDLEVLGTYYDGAVLTIAVPQYMEDVNSIEDLVGQADRFDGKIIGIEPSAGLTRVTQESMMPAYGLDDYELVTSSTAGMLATLDTAVAAEEDIVVTLWRPFWAYNDWPMKDLEDPKGAMGEPEQLKFVAHAGVSEEMPEAAEFFGSLKLNDEQYGALEGLVTGDEYEGDPAAAVDAWLEEYGSQIDWVVE